MIQQPSLDRAHIADHIVKALSENSENLRLAYKSCAPINHFVIDDVLPLELAKAVGAAFPKPEAMFLRKSLKEVKYVSAQMNAHPRILEEAIFAFHDQRVVDAVTEITGLAALEPDRLLYAGGISMMGKGHYLNPHIDNSHDKTRSRYRVLNLLYYAAPDWVADKGGNLELWPQGVMGVPITIHSKFNRLAVMVTHEGSWHSVSPIKVDRARLCVSNYYFSDQPVGGQPYFHVTSFRGRPEQPARDFMLRADNAARMFVRRLFPKGVAKVTHFYKR